MWYTNKKEEGVISVYPDEYMDDIFTSDMAEDIVMIVIMAVLAVMVISAIVGIVTYVFQSLGMYTIAKRRGIKNPWLAWLPVVSYWISGSISDQYRYVVRGQVRYFRVIMVALSAAGVVLSGLSSAASSAVLLEALEYIAAEDTETALQLLSAAGTGSFLSLLGSVTQLALFVFWQIALYDLYTSCDPKNNVLFLVLGIIFSFLVPFFIFANRNKELGMPPRRPEPRQQPEEPWENA